MVASAVDSAPRPLVSSKPFVREAVRLECRTSHSSIRLQSSGKSWIGMSAQSQSSKWLSASAVPTEMAVQYRGHT